MSTIRVQTQSQPWLGSDFFSTLRQACVTNELQTSFPNFDFTTTPIGSTACKAVPQVIGDPAGLSIGVLSPLVNVCIAQWAMHISEMSEPLHISYEEQPWSPGPTTSDGFPTTRIGSPVVLPHGNELPAHWVEGSASGALGVYSSFFKYWDPTKVKYRYRVKPPSASDRASWALVATELFRSAALHAIWALSNPSCADTLNTQIATANHDTTTPHALLAATLADASMSAIEAAEKAQKLIGAAASQKIAVAGARESTLVESWRGRHDSRLEGANAFVPLAEELFEHPQVATLYEVVDPDDNHKWLTTQSEGDYYTRGRIGYIYPADATPLGTLGTDYQELLTVEDSAGVRLNATGPVTGYTVVRREGWFLKAPGDGTVAKAMPAPAGFPATTINMFADENTVVDTVASNRYPVVTTMVRRKADTLAEDMLRQARVNPCLSGQSQTESACGAVLSEVTTRTISNVADDLLAALKLQNPGAYSTFNNSGALLAAQGIHDQDIALALRRIVQSSSALGRPLALDAVGVGPRLVSGTQYLERAVEPAFLYARTAGNPADDLTAPVNPLDTANLDAADYHWARGSVASMLEVIDRKLITALQGPEGEWTGIMQRLRGAIEAYTDNADGTVAIATPTAGTIDRVTISRRNLDFANPTAIKASCSAWLNEDGLACGLANDGSTRCQGRVFAETGGMPDWSSVVSDDPRQKKTTFVLFASQAPQRTIGGTLKKAILPGDRIYVICDGARGPQVVSAVTATLPRPGSDSLARQLTPMSDAVLEALSTSLAPDPRRPEQSALSCAGVPYNVKIPLENELTEATDGKDDIESSFAHYLALAREAATRADELGSQLVQQGLDMDVRSEQARDELEDICGGVINVPSFAQAACDKSESCSIPDLLGGQAMASSGNASFDSDTSGVSACLGLSKDSAPTWAAVGDQPLCLWFYNPKAPSPKPLPMVCPGSDKCKNLSHNVLLMSAADCKTMYDPDGSAHVQELPPNGGALTEDTVYARPITEALNVYVTKHDTKDLPQTSSKFPCREMLARRLKDASYRRPEWADQFTIKAAADAIGYEDQHFGVPRLTRGGDVWVNFGTATAGPSATVTDGWPYAMHSDLVKDTTDPQDVYDEEAAKLCTGSGRSRSLLCGGYTKNDYQEISDRLQKAVISLKGIAGGSFDNVKIRLGTIAGVGSLAMFSGIQVVTPGMIRSTLPSWLPVTGATPYYVAADNSFISYMVPVNYLFPNAALNVFESIVPYRGARVTADLRTWEQNTSKTIIDTATFKSSGWVPAESLWTSGNAKYVGPEGDGSFSDDSYLGVYVGTGGAESFLAWNPRNTAPTEVKSMVFYPTTSCTFTPVPDSIQACKITGPDYTYWSAYHGMGIETCSGGWTFEDGATTGPVYKGEQLIALIGNDATARRDTTLKRYFAPTGTMRNVVNDHADPGYDDEWSAYNQLLPYMCTGNGTLIGTTVDHDTMMDALDLACIALHDTPVSCETLLREELNVAGIEDFPRLNAKVQCAADAVQEQLDRMYVANLPLDVVKQLSASGAVQTFPEYRGTFGQTVADIGAELITLRSQGDMAVSALREAGTVLERATSDADALQLNIEIGDVDAHLSTLNVDQAKNALDIQNIHTKQAISTSATTCASSVASAVGGFNDWVTGRAESSLVAAAATCANSAIQIKAEKDIKNLNAEGFEISQEVDEATKERIRLGQQATGAELNSLMLNIGLEVASKIDKVREAFLGVQAAQARVHSLLAKLDSQRNQASRAAAKVLLLSSDSLGRQYAVNTTMRARMNTLRIRYEQARDNAIRMAYLARRAVEQKLGVDLSLMGDDMTLVEAPNKWADTLCSLSGIDYEKIRTGGGGTSADDSSDGDKAPEDYDYADGYIGDWVTRLENFVESYTVDRPFQAGEDIAVVSLRDEIMSIRAPMDPIDGWNMLYHTDGELYSSKDNKGRQYGWEFTCGSNVQMATPFDKGPTPFACGGDPNSCRSLGTARGTTLVGKAVSSCVAPANGAGTGSLLSAIASNAPAEPPTGNREYWFRGDACTEVTGSPGWVSSCANKGINVPGQTRTLRSFAANTNLKLVANGIGGQPTLEFPANSLSGTQGHPDLVTAMSVAVVIRPLNSGQSILLNANHTLASPANVTPVVNGGAVSLQVSNGSASFTWQSSTPIYQAQLSGPIALGPSKPDSRGEILVATADSTGAKLYVNGVLTSWSDLGMTPQKLGGYLAQLPTGSIRDRGAHRIQS
ncbi:MAG: hypothetical protein QM778_39150 [Myxococcales bacterium]